MQCGFALLLIFKVSPQGSDTEDKSSSLSHSRLLEVHDTLAINSTRVKDGHDSFEIFIHAPGVGLWGWGRFSLNITILHI